MRLGAIRFVVGMLANAIPIAAIAGTPDCTGVDRWPTMSAVVRLQNAGLLKREQIDFAKTQVVRLASEAIGTDLYRQIHKVTFFRKSGVPVVIITTNEVSSQECSMSSVEVFVVSKQLAE